MPHFTGAAALRQLPQIVKKDAFTPWPPLRGGSARRRWGRELYGYPKYFGLWQGSLPPPLRGTAPPLAQAPPPPYRGSLSRRGRFFDALRELPLCGSSSFCCTPTKKALPQNGQGQTGSATKGYQHKGATRRRQALSMLPKNPFRQSFRPIWREADSMDSKSRKISCSTSPP